ncbi:sulfatase-like hydrolase/transferase [Sinomicrobium kalidii]|uniref:sulfatase-like hydrolase/transferase n=1 Tax=Sinomicrobium kalidii TaxID=2900738 RepID=UPI001E350BFC|nr:sulfatase-like hydrolase/transferase [Sinomicrobium kalidii]UGU15878.1 sulfatase-like hydrolase/transferase [Sinomicrobium kalidii]
MKSLNKGIGRKNSSRKATLCYNGGVYDRPFIYEKPNIILIMSDDMGYSDIDAYGGEVNTPALDSLAKNGMKFTQFYNTARCWT